MDPTPPAFPPVATGAILIRRLARLARTWWSDRKAGRRADEPAAMIEPFAYWPGHVGALQGGENAGSDVVPGYAFRTKFIPSSGGTIRFTIVLKNLAASRGNLLLHLMAIDERGGETAIRPKIRSISLAKLARTGRPIRISHLGQYRHSYALMGIVTGPSDARASEVEISVQGSDGDDAMAVRLEAARRAFLAAPGKGLLADRIVDRPATMAEPISQMCTAAQMAEPIYRDWCHRIANEPRNHRKQWEFVFIMRALEYYGALRSGARGLGFGVGIEPLSSVFAAMGCRIVATDLPADDERALVWDNSNQLGGHLERIHHPHLCEADLFFDNVAFRTVDMNAIPADLRDFDFTWSSCAYEHLGSIEKGLAFFENSLACLRPGGIAVHTTELNLSSNDDTLDHDNTVIFRRQDFEVLASRLIERGHDVIPITFDSGDAEPDRVIDMPPYSEDAHLKIALLRWVTTSFGLIVRKGGGPAREATDTDVADETPACVLQA